MKFLIDDQLPINLAHTFVRAGYEAVHVSECGLGGHDDRPIWRHACAEGFVIVTKDADFIRLQSARPPHAPVLWIRLGNTRKGPLLKATLGALDDVVTRFERGAMIVELC